MFQMAYFNPINTYYIYLVLLIINTELLFVDVCLVFKINVEISEKWLLRRQSNCIKLVIATAVITNLNYIILALIM